jgi:hypothetical protein
MGVPVPRRRQGGPNGRFLSQPEPGRKRRKRFDNAAVTISGIELAEKIKKGQYKTGKLGGRKATMSELWNAALAA